MWSEKDMCPKCGEEMFKEHGATYCWKCDVPKPKPPPPPPNSNATKSCMDYLSLIDIYSRRINQSTTLKEAKDWADRMLDHALRIN